MIDEKTFLGLAIQASRRSREEGNFPAGAAVVREGKVLATAVSSPYPNLLHADSKAITQAFNEHGALQGATLYVGLEPCLMCTSIAYWAGIRRIVYAVPKSSLNRAYYETHKDTSDIIESFNEKMTFIEMADYEATTLLVIRDWEKEKAL